MTLDELIARWTKKSSGFRSSEFGIGKQEGIQELLDELCDVDQDARIAELTAEVGRVKGLVETAYREGFSSGADDAMQDERGRGGYGMDQLWQISDTRNALDATRTPKEQTK